MTSNRLRLVIFPDALGVWIVRGLEHDLGAEAGSIGEAVRAAMRFVQAHTDFDIRHAHRPLAAFPPSPQKYWNAFAAGASISLSELGITAPANWDIQLAYASGGLRKPHWRQVSVRTRAAGARAPLDWQGL